MSNRVTKVALVTGGLPFGGTSTFSLHLATGLRDAGIPCEVLSFTRENPFAADFGAAAIPVHLSDETRLIFEDRLERIYETIADFEPTVVIANIGREAYEVLRYLPSGVVRIGMVHDMVMNPDQLIPTYRDALDYVVVVGAHLLNDVRTVSGSVPCVHLAHGIPMPKQVPPRVSNPSGPLRIIYYGRLIVGKGARIFPAIMDELHRRQIPFQWTILGSGVEEPYLRDRLAAEIASGEVTLSSPVKRDRLFQLIRQHDVYIMASDVEGGPLTLLEAMYLGLVPVCSDIPCLVQELINPENGFRVSRTKPDEYAEAMGRLHNDRALLERMSAAARRTVTADYTVEAMVQRYVNLFHQTCLTAPDIVWPKRIKPMAIRAVSNPWSMMPVFRPLRRLAKRLDTFVRK